MGADSFITASWGKTAEEAFKRAVKEAQYEHGHGGYTGTIAEKDEFTMIPLPEHKDPMDFAQEMIDGDGRVGDKWGPCGCTEVPKELHERIAKASYLDRKGKPNEKLFLFYGWASS